MSGGVLSFVAIFIYSRFQTTVENGQGDVSPSAGRGLRYFVLTLVRFPYFASGGGGVVVGGYDPLENGD